MRSSDLIAITVLALAGCGGELEAVSVSEEPVLWAACTAEESCPVSENCFDVAVGGDVGSCPQLCNNDGTNCTNPQQCTAAKPYCCQSVACIQNALTDPLARTFYIAGIQSGCHTGVSCQPCPAGKVRDTSNPGSAACCQPTYSCAGRACGTVNDNCGWAHSCGTCASGQTCTSSGCCALTQAQACAGRCGNVSDGCGGTYNCGCCRLTQAQACAGKNCGTVSDGCGGTYSCGSCGQHEFCSGGNVCACSSPYHNCGDSPPASPSCELICR